MKIRGKEFEIDSRKFYQIGIAAFLIMGVMNLATLLQTYEMLLLTQIISQIGGIVFNFALLGLFVHVYRSLPPKDVQIASDSELKSILGQAVRNSKEKVE